MKYCWTLTNSDFNIIEKLKRYSDEIWSENLKIYDIRESSHVCRTASGKKKFALEFDEFYTFEKEKRIPDYILNESIENRKWFLIGFYAANGHRNNSSTQKHKISKSGLNYLCQSLGLKTCIGMRIDQINVFYLNAVKKLVDKKFHEFVNKGKVIDYMYDIETESHDFNYGFPLIVHNTD